MPTTTFADGLPTPMLALNRDEMPVGEGWTYEPKWDGFRTIVAVADDGVDLVSRTGRPLARYFPEVADAGGRDGRRERCVLDGEIVMVRPGAMDFGHAPAAAAPGGLAREQARRRDPRPRSCSSTSSARAATT